MTRSWVVRGSADLVGISGGDFKETEEGGGRRAVETKGAGRVCVSWGHDSHPGLMLHIVKVEYVYLPQPRPSSYLLTEFAVTLKTSDPSTVQIFLLNFLLKLKWVMSA